MMDPESDIQGSKARMPVQPIPDMTREMLDSCNERQHGFRSKRSSTVPPILKACAEDELVKKEYKEMRCDIPGLTKSTFLMVFSPDGTKMASTHGNHNVYVTDLRTGKNIKTLVGHPRTPWCVAFHPSSNQILASGCLGGQVRIWDLSGGSEVWTAESQTVISSLAFHPVDRLLVIATYNELYFWDWSQPQPFMQTCTSSAKEKVRYVAFDPLGHKLITGIANTPQGFTRWERVRAPVPVARHSDRITAYRRRITPRLVPHTTNTQTAGPSAPEPLNLSTIPERERRIAVCYRNLVEQYEMLVHRYLDLYRPTTTIDRGTDPMETEHLNNTASTTTTNNSTTTTCNSTTTTTTSTAANNKPDAPTVTTSAASTTSTQTITPSTSRISPPPVAGPSGLCRPTANRATKRLNVCATKSDSSTVYQSDSSSSSSSDESPTPKRRIPIIPNNIFRSKSETTSNPVKNVKDSSTCTSRKKFLLSRPSAFHLARSSSQSNTGGGNTRRSFDRYSYPHSESDTTNRSIREQPRISVTERTTNPRITPQVNSHLITSQITNPPVSNSQSTTQLDDLPFPLGRLRGISEGSLSSADEVINFSERPMANREPEADATENFTPDLPNETEFPQQNGSIENIYTHLLSDLESSLLEARNTTRTDANRFNETSNSLSTISDRVESIMTQSDAILANLRRGMESLMEPTTQNQPTNSNSADNSAARRIFILRKPSGFHSHTRQCLPRCCGTSSRSSTQNNNSQSHAGSSSIRGNRYFRIRQPRLNVRQPGSAISSVWRPFDDHSYPRDPDQNAADPGRSSNVEPIRSLLTLSPRSPSAGAEEEEQVERNSTPAPFPTSEHNYPLSDPPPRAQELPQVSTNSENPIADHTYPRDPQNTTNSTHQNDYIEPLVNSLHSTISHISIQTNILRRQFESIEMIDRARVEVFQLQELRRMWEEIRRHLNFPNPAANERRSNMSNVRQMLAWARISDPSPSSESAQSSTEQSTSELSPNPGDRPTPSTSRSSASSSNESRPHPPFVNRLRQSHVKKRTYWRRRAMKNDGAHFNPRRYLRGLNHREREREVTRTSTRTDIPPGVRTDNSSLSEFTVSVMIRGVEHLLIQQCRLIGRRDLQNSPERTSSIEYRMQSERVIQTRLRAARVRLNRINGNSSNSIPNYLEEPVEYSSLGNRNDWIRYETRLRLSIYVETLTRYVEGNSNIPQVMSDQIKNLIELALLLTDLLLLQIMESIPTLSGTLLDPERETLSHRITQMCTNMLQNSNTVRSTSLIRVLHDLRVATRCNPSSTRLQTRRNERTEISAEARNTAREAMLDLNRQLRRLYQYTNYLSDPDPNAPLPSLPPLESNANTSIESSMSHVYRLGDLLTRLRNVRGRLEQVSQSAFPVRPPPNSNSTTEQEPMRSTDESPSDRESEPFEGFQSWERDQRVADPPGSLYRTSHINLYPPEQSSSQSSPEQGLPPINRNWTIPTVHVNDVPVAEVLPPQPRIWLHRYPSELRPLGTATGLFRPRFLIPLYSGVNPFDAELDDPHREIGYDGLMSTVFPNHRIQMWDISNCNIPNISNHDKNIVVSECKIHNDGSVDISSDGTLLVTLLPGGGGYLNVTNKLGIYSIKWDTLGQCLYTTSFEQNAISVSLSPLSRHLIVGLASRRVTLLPSDRWTMARIFLLDDRNVKIMGRGRLVVLRDLEQGRERDLNFMSVNCIKWMPMSGQGIVYATNTGQLKVLT